MCKDVFNEILRERGCCVPKSSYKMGVEADDFVAGDRLLFALAKNAGEYLNKNGTSVDSECGLTADGKIGFNKWFSTALNARKTGRRFIENQFPSCITRRGYEAAREISVRNDYLLSPGLVRDMRLSFLSSAVAVCVNPYEIVALDRDGECAHGTEACFLNGYYAVFPYEKFVKESRRAVITRFLKFAFSMSNFSFPNISEIEIRGLTIRDVRWLLSGGVRGIAGAGKMYANPCVRLFMRGIDEESHEIYVRDASPDFVEVVEKYKSDSKELSDELPSLDAMRIGKFSEDYFGDYLMRSVSEVPFGYGKTFEETVVKAINYHRAQFAAKKDKGSSGGASGRQVLFDDF